MICDSHIHLLPEIDFGAVDVDESALMLRRMEHDGIRYAVAAPHLDFRKDTVATFLCKRKAAYEKIKHLCRSITVFPSVELDFSSDTAYLPELKELMNPVFSFLPITLPLMRYDDCVVRDLSYLMQKRKITPMILHTERYTLLYSKEELKRLFSLPYAIFQFGLSSLFDRKITQTAFDLYRSGKPVLFASNAHHALYRAPVYTPHQLFLQQNRTRLAFEKINAHNDRYFEKIFK